MTANRDRSRGRPLTVGELLMPRRSRKEIDNWHEFSVRGRDFVRAIVPRGANEDQWYTVARRIADRYEVKRFFASGGCGLILAGRDDNTEAEVLIKMTLRYDCTFEAQGRDRAGFTRKLQDQRKQLQTERRIMVLVKNQGCNAIPNPNDYVYDWNPMLAGPYRTDNGKEWCYDDEGMLSSEPYLILEAIEGETLEDLIKEEWRDGVEEHRGLEILRQVINVLRILHRPVQMANGAIWRIVYQDLKPANILLGEHDYAVLIDFGGCWVTVNGQAVMMGASSAGYCPPECGKQGSTLTPAADSYTVGSTLYHLLTGQSPTDLLSGGLAGTERHVRPDRWDWDLLSRKASAATVRLVRTCLEPGAKDRPADGSTLHDALVRLLG
jgi:serine/threonine protein kinase